MNPDDDNPERSSHTHLPDAGGSDLATPLALPGANGGAPPVPVPAQADAATVGEELSVAAEPANDILSAIATALRRLDERVGRIEALLEQPAPAPARRMSIAAPSSPGQFRFLLLALAAAATVLLLRLVQLDQLQAEMYGDINIVYEYVAAILAGKWPTYFDLSSGPLYHYLIVPIVLLAGRSYFGLKLASVIVSLGVLASTYALARRLIDDRFALLAVFVAGVSSWLLIFSRLGNSQIIVPLLATCALWLAVRVAQHGRASDAVACAAVATLGLYGYPQSFVIAPVIGLTLICLRWAGWRIRWATLLWFGLACIVCALPFGLIVARDPALFFSGYIGGKLEAIGSPAQVLLDNVVRTLLALHVRGDTGFRSNPVGAPHLDWISGLLFFGGVVFWLLPERRRWSPALLVPLVLLQVPSMLVLKESRDIPSASRTLGVAPIVYILVASGLWWLLRSARALRPRWLAPALGGILLGAIVLLNAQRYFISYIAGLPYQNTPMGRIITTYVDTLPPDTQIYLVGCCWEYAMPEPLSIQYSMARPDQLHRVEPANLSCPQLQSLPKPAVLIWSFHVDLPAPQLEPCRAWLPAQVYGSVAGRPVFNAAPLRIDAASGAALPLDVFVADAPLVADRAQLDGQTLDVLHSSLDIGSVGDLFDNNPDSLIRGQAANPLVLVLRFAQPRSIKALGLKLGTIPQFQIKAQLTREDGTTVDLDQSYKDLPADPLVELPIPGGPQLVRSVRIEIADVLAAPTDEVHIHVRDIRLS